MDDLIDTIYETGAMPELWPGLLQKLGDSYGAFGGLLFSFGGDGVRSAGPARCTAVMDEFVAEGWMEHNDRPARALAMMHPGFLCDTDFYTEAEMLEIPMYRDFLVPKGMIAAAGCAFRGATDDKIIISVEGFRSHDACASAVPSLNELRPHLARAAMLSSQMKLERARAMAAALQVIGAPAAVLDGHGRVRAANLLFEGLMGKLFFDNRSGLRVRALNERRLETTLAKIRAGGAGASLGLPPSEGQPPSVLHLLPVRACARDVFGDLSVIAVFSGGPTHSDVPDAVLQSLFDLTGAEVRVAWEIGQGRSIREIAVKNEVSENTVRNQVKAIFHKVGVERQSELAVLLGRLRLR